MKTASSPSIAAAPGFDIAGYHEVLVLKTGEVEGHGYRRGTRPTVDGATLQKLRDAGLIDDAATRPAAG